MYFFMNYLPIEVPLPGQWACQECRIADLIRGCLCCLGHVREWAQARRENRGKASGLPGTERRKDLSYIKLGQNRIYCWAMNEIKFGTDGWRGEFAEDFTRENVRKVAHAI